MNIGKRLRQLRLAKGITQRDIYKRTGIFNGYVSQVELGKNVPQLSTLEKWAMGLEVPLCRPCEAVKAPNHNGGDLSAMRVCHESV